MSLTTNNYYTYHHPQKGFFIHTCHISNCSFSSSLSIKFPYLSMARAICEPDIYIYTVCSKKSDAKIEITITARQILSELNILLAALIITFLVQMLQISTKSTAQFLSNSCLKNGTQKQKFPIWKGALAVRTQYHQLQFVLKVVTICTDICMSLVQIVRSLLLPDFLSADPVASVCRRSRSCAEQDQSLLGNSFNNFLALLPLLCHKTFISIPSSLVKTIAFYVNQTHHKNVTNIMSLFLTLPAVSRLIGIFHIRKFCF